MNLKVNNLANDVEEVILMTVGTTGGLCGTLEKKERRTKCEEL